MTTPTPSHTWADTYAVLFTWRLTLNEIKALEYDLFLHPQRRFPDLTQTEIEGALAEHAETSLDSKPPGLATIRRLVATRRTATTTPAASIGPLKERLRTSSPIDRWNTICEGPTIDACHELEAYAASLPGGYVHPADRRASAPVTQATTQLQSPDQPKPQRRSAH